MTPLAQLPHPPRLLLFGTRGLFSRLVLEGLVAQGQSLLGVALPGEGAGLVALPRPAPLALELPMVPSFTARTIAEIAWERAIPVWALGRLDEGALSAIAALAPDAIVVACWPRRLPGPLLALPRWGCLNVHPSLLPHFRGPAPLFWQRRAGLTEAGVSIHQMSARLDEGPILAQAPLPLPDGATGAQLDALAARLGAQLLGGALAGLARGTLHPQPQPPDEGSYQGWPREADFHISTHWSARHAWNFAHAADEWGHPFTLLLPDGPRPVGLPRAFDPAAPLDVPWRQDTAGLAVAFSPGVVWW